MKNGKSVGVSASEGVELEFRSLVGEVVVVIVGTGADVFWNVQIGCPKGSR